MKKWLADWWSDADIDLQLPDLMSQRLPTTSRLAITTMPWLATIMMLAHRSVQRALNQALVSLGLVSVYVSASFLACLLADRT